jgi:hypothetical protein
MGAPWRTSRRLNGLTAPADTACSRAGCWETEQQLDRPDIAGAPVGQRGLGAPHGMGRVLERVEPSAADPLGDEAGILSSGQMLVRTGAPLEQALPKPSARSAQVVVERLARHLSQLEPDGSTGLALRPMLGGRARKASLPVRNRLSGPVLTTLFVTERRSWSVSGSARQR